MLSTKCVMSSTRGLSSNSDRFTEGIAVMSKRSLLESMLKSTLSAPDATDHAASVCVSSVMTLFLFITETIARHDATAPHRPEEGGKE